MINSSTGNLIFKIGVLILVIVVIDILSSRPKDQPDVGLTYGDGWQAKIRQPDGTTNILTLGTRDNYPKLLIWRDEEGQTQIAAVPPTNP